MKFDRRRFLQLAGAAGVALIAPPLFADQSRGKVVVFVELSGGNDGLNTVIPHTDPLYRQLRPNIAIPTKDVLTLDPQTALHPSLKNLATVWGDGELAIVEGLGYPNPNRSHFRSIEIWETASSADEYMTEGWVSRVAPDKHLERFTPPGLTLGGGGDGVLAGTQTLGLDEPARLKRQVRGMRRVDEGSKNPALAHVLRTHNELLEGVDAVTKYADKAPSFDKLFKDGKRLRPLALAAEMIASGMPLMAVKVRVGGFDTHVNQVPTHARLLEQLDTGLGAFRDAMKSAGMWDDVLVVTYSEFGRRAGENGGGGTDHGTAAPQLLLGGGVVGGRYGARPRLDDLDGNKDLKHTTDFRSLYRTIGEKWWGLDAKDFKGFQPLPLLG